MTNRSHTDDGVESTGHGMHGAVHTRARACWESSPSWAANTTNGRCSVRYSCPAQRFAPREEESERRGVRLDTGAWAVMSRLQ